MHLESVGLSIWSDRKIRVGDEWDGVIKQELFEADIILLLVSVDFNTSKYCNDIEVAMAVERHEKGEARCIPIFVSECNFSNMPYAKLQGLPNDAKFITDTTNWPDLNKPLTNIATTLKKEVDKLLKERLNVSPPVFEAANSKKDEDAEEDLVAALKLIIEKKKNLSFDSTKEDIADYKVLADRLLNELYSFDEKVENIPALTDKYPIELFNQIYTTEKLSKPLIATINDIRNSSNYKWYQRALIVSAITISLIHHKAVDQNKILLLIDFVNDKEDKVWQRAIVGLVLALTHRKNAWIKFDAVKRRLQTLKTVADIQSSLSLISSLLETRLYLIYSSSEELYKLPFVESQPANCFIPFYCDNPAIKYFLDNSNGNDAEDVVDRIEKLPLPDFVKYTICYESNTKDKVKVVNENHKEYLQLLFGIADFYKPYLQIVSDIYGFFRFFPLEQREDVFTKNFSIANSSLKDLVFDELGKLNMLAAHHMNLKQWKEALEYWVKVNKLKSEIGSLTNTALCYRYLDNAKAEISVRLKIYDKYPNYNENILEIQSVYASLKNYEESWKWLNLTHVNDANRDKINKVKIELFIKEKKFNEAIAILDLVIAVNPSAENTYQRASALFEMEDYKGALVDLNNALAVNDTYSKAYYLMGKVYFELEEFDSAIQSFSKSIEIEPRNAKYHSELAFAFGGKGDTESYGKAFRNALKYEKNNDIINYNYSIYLATKKEYTKAIEYVDKALSVNSKNPDYCLMRAMTLTQIGSFESAIFWLNKALELGSVDNLIISIIYSKCKNYVKSLYYADLAEPLNALGYRHRSHVHFHLGDFSSALIDCDEAFKLEQSFINYETKILLYAKNGNFSEAKFFYAKGLALAKSEDKLILGAEIAWYEGQIEEFYTKLHLALEDGEDIDNLEEDIVLKCNDDEKFKELKERYSKNLNSMYTIDYKGKQFSLTATNKTKQ